MHVCTKHIGMISELATPSCWTTHAPGLYRTPGQPRPLLPVQFSSSPLITSLHALSLMLRLLLLSYARLTHTEEHVMKEDLAKETGTTAVLAAVATRRKRAPCPRVSSRHFDTESKAASEASAEQLPKALKGFKGERRSEYFTSTPDSCAGSASSFDWGSAFTEKAFFALKSCEHFEHTGVRHVCKKRCYFRAYEPVRKWHALRLAVARVGASTGVLTGWCVQMDGGQAAEDSWRIRYVAPDVGISANPNPL